MVVEEVAGAPLHSPGLGGRRITVRARFSRSQSHIKTLLSCDAINIQSVIDPCMEATYPAITTHMKAQNARNRGHFTCLEVCCYGIDLDASIVRFNQSTNRSDLM